MLACELSFWDEELELTDCSEFLELDDDVSVCDELDNEAEELALDAIEDFAESGNEPVPLMYDDAEYALFPLSELLDA